jgi:hypothetical protein
VAGAAADEDGYLARPLRGVAGNAARDAADVPAVRGDEAVDELLGEVVNPQ